VKPYKAGGGRAPRKTSGEVFRFLLNGGLFASLSLAMFIALDLGTDFTPWEASATCALVLAVPHFLVSRKWVFHGGGRSANSVVLYGAIAAFQIQYSYLAVWFLNDVLKIIPVVSFVLAALLWAAASYAVSKFAIFAPEGRQ